MQLSKLLTAILVSSFITLPLVGTAHDFTSDHQVTNWRSEIAITVEDLFDEISYEAYDIWTGDDGEECNANVWNVEITKYHSPTSFEFSFIAEQDYEFSWACIAGEFFCSGKVDVVLNGRSSGSHKISSKIECE
ncbi:MAG: hypothetical protein HN730_03660, partial [Bdellovibrionales bacterium]|nr:hypothetical protein [Bdellovibrionales bacterium]